MSSRLLARNAIQFAAIIIVVVLSSILFQNVIDEVYRPDPLETVQYSEDCFTVFDYNKCYFPFRDQGYDTGIAVCRDIRSGVRQFDGALE